MRILADENLSKLLVSRLRDAGHDVVWMREAGPGTPDPEVLALAQMEQRITATFDLGFGELAFRSRLPSACGILLLRVRGGDPTTVADLVLEALGTRKDWTGVFGVMTARGIRVRPLPPR